MKNISFILLFVLLAGCNHYRSSDNSKSRVPSATGGATSGESPAPFVSEWRTTVSGESITLPLRSGFNYNFTVDWGDSSSDIITAFDDAAITHTYARAGVYTVTISGLVEAWFFDWGGDNNKIIKVVDLGDVGWKNLEAAFAGCENLVSLAGGVTTNVTDMSWMFDSAVVLSSLNLSNFDTSNVTDMSGMFSYALGLRNLDLSRFDTSRVTNMSYMFSRIGITGLLNLSSFNTANVTNMKYMFWGTAASSLDLSNFRTSEVRDMSYMFAYANNLTSLNTNNWDLGRAFGSGQVFLETNTNLKVFCDQDGSHGTGTFFGQPCIPEFGFLSPSNNSFAIKSTLSTFPLAGTCKTGPGHSTTITISGAVAATTTTCNSGYWSKVVDLSNLPDGPISILITQDSSSNSRIFRIDTTDDFISVWRTTNANETIRLPLRSGYNYNFTVDWGDSSPVSTVTSFDDPDITHEYATGGEYIVRISGLVEAWHFNFSGDKNKIIMVADLGDVGWKNLLAAFAGCENLVSFAGGVTSDVTNMNGMFNLASSLTSLNLSEFDTSNVTDMSRMFRGLNKLTNINISSFNTSSVTNMSEMFEGMWSLTSLNLSGFDTSRVTDMSRMFTSIGVTSIDVSNFNTSNVTNMNAMFAGLFEVTSLNLSSFDTSNVTNMYAMFLGLGVSSLNLSIFDTSNVTNMGYMFGSMNGLTSLDISHFNMSNVTDMQGMFDSSFNLTSLNLSGLDTSRVTNMSYMFRGATGLTSLDLSSFNTNNVTNMNYMFGSTSGLTSLNVTNWNISAASGSSGVFYFENGGLLVTCNQGVDGANGKGKFFGKDCN